ncbi:exodeoxyribonuclease VII large subunit [Spiroplasma endosymbiont of Polydrusus formosus]|uniref:exodeoxyribonuclease VII large subunit n=1 Tax=Spiroplasma endosymbiont of Polydrusus formosus TaxID=3139326 RepID=UPI0035B5047C
MLKKLIPRFPKNIGIIIAPTGAAIRDIISTIHRRFPQTNIYLFPSLVQGAEAKHDICAKIKAAQTFKP